MKDKKKQTKTSFYSHKPQMNTIRPNGVNDKYPNDNLFNKDKRYRMNKYLNFDSNDEQAYQQIQKALFSLKLEHLSVLGGLRLLYNFNYSSVLDYYKSTYYLIFFTLSYYFIRICHLHNRYLEMFIKILFLLNSVFIILENYTPPALTIQFIASELFFFYIHGLFLHLSLIYSLFSFCLLTSIHIYKAVRPKIIKNTLFGFLKALNSINGFASLSALGFFVLIFYYYSKGKRELWALYDSFKKSYLIFDEIIFKKSKAPAFVVSKNFSILCANPPAFDFLEKLKDNKLKAKRGFNGQNDIMPNLNLLDFINPQLKDEFLLKFNTCLAEKMHKFFFSFECNKQKAEINNQFPKQNHQSGTNYKVISSRCVWKNQESYFVRICKEVIEASLYNYLFCYSKYLIEELFSLTHEVDKICERLIDSEIKYEQYTIIFNKLNNRNITGNENDTLNKIIQQKAPLDNKTFTVNSNDNKEHYESTQFNSNIINNNDHFFYQNKRTNINQLFTNIDHSFFYYFKNQFEVFYDIQLTQEIFTSILLQTPCIVTSHIDLKSLANYFEDYFYMILRMKHLKLKFIIKCDSNISIEYSFLRCIMFNTLMFIYSNTDDDVNEKSIIYTISLEKEPKVSSEMFDFGKKKRSKAYGYTEINEDCNFDLFNQNNTHILKFLIVIWDDKPKTNLNEILKNLQMRTQLFFHFQEEIEKLNRLDIGLLTLFYLINAVYSKELEMFSKEGEHTIAFEIGCGITKKEDEVMHFDEIDSNISDGYYKDLLRRVFHVNIPDEEFRAKSFNKGLPKESKSKHWKKKNYKTSISQSNKTLKVNGSDNSSNDMSIGYSDTENTNEKNVKEEEQNKTSHKNNYSCKLQNR